MILPSSFAVIATGYFIPQGISVLNPRIQPLGYFIPWVLENDKTRSTERTGTHLRNVLNCTQVYTAVRVLTLTTEDVLLLMFFRQKNKKWAQTKWPGLLS